MAFQSREKLTRVISNSFIRQVNTRANNASSCYKGIRISKKI